MLKILNLSRKNEQGTYDDIAIKQNLPEEYTFTLSSGNWVGAVAPFTQDVTINGITAESTGIFGLAPNVSSSVLEEVCAAQLQLTSQSSNTVTISAYKLKPTVDIPCIITNVHNAKLEN